ncbi:MAG TPA: hypothetical protein VM489_03580 [Burkholderiales bacterium]|jgi:hypothetical protein|nr:hypothetical protein [Burkholderiales bacterium]
MGMSAAATAAGYLYASGRLRGRNLREQESPHESETKTARPAARPAKRPKVAVYHRDHERRETALEEPREAAPPPSRPAPKIQYRTRRWKPE